MPDLLRDYKHEGVLDLGWGLQPGRGVGLKIGTNGGGGGIAIISGSKSSCHMADAIVAFLLCPSRQVCCDVATE